jgi:hypothetical protein
MLTHRFIKDKASHDKVVGQFEANGARTVPVRSRWQRQRVENSPIDLALGRAADGDRPRSGPTREIPTSKIKRFAAPNWCLELEVSPVLGAF